VLAVTLDDERLVTAQEEATRIAFRELETFAVTRVRKQGGQKDRTTGNLAAAAFTHTSSRALDPQLHTHFTVFNATFDGSERSWKALQAGCMYDAIRYGTAVYRNELAKRVQQIGYRIQPSKHGFQIEGVSDEVLQRFSKRSQQRDAVVQELEQKLGRKLSKNAISLAVHQSRAEKVKGISTAELTRAALSTGGRAESKFLSLSLGWASGLRSNTNTALASCVALAEADGLFEAVQMGEGDEFFMLEAADDDAGGDAELDGESFDALRAKPPILTESRELVLRNEEFGGEGVGLLFFAEGFLVGGAILGFDKDVAFAVLEDVGAFMEESEPKEVVLFAAETELEHGLGRGEPAGCAVSPGGGEFRDKDEGDTGGTAEFGCLGDKFLCRETGEPTYIVKGFDESVLAVGVGSDLLSEAFTLAEPSGGSHGIGFKGRGFEISDFGRGPDGFPFFDAGDAEEVEQGAELLDRGMTMGNPALFEEGCERKLVKPSGVGDKAPILLEASAGGFVVPLGGVPEVGRDSGSALELDRGFSGDGLLALDDLTDHLEGPAHTLGQFGLGHAEFFEGLGKGVTRVDGVVRFKHESVVGAHN
jgi:hypothetical protein